MRVLYQRQHGRHALTPTEAVSERGRRESWSALFKLRMLVCCVGALYYTPSHFASASLLRDTERSASQPPRAHGPEAAPFWSIHSSKRHLGIVYSHSGRHRPLFAVLCGHLGHPYLSGPTAQISDPEKDVRAPEISQQLCLSAPRRDGGDQRECETCHDFHITDY